MDKSSLKNPSEVTALFIDHGLFISQALRLAQTFKKVYCYTPWETAFPKMTSMIGYGYDELELVDSIFGPHFDEIDIFIFPDINSGPLQQYLVDQGKIVWGCRLGECLELDREGMKDILKALDLPVGKFEHIKGMDNLRSYLKEKKNVYVKINKWRGTFETFKSENYNQVEPKLDEVEHKLGPLKHIIEFTVEDQLEEPNMFEGGTDGFVIDGEYPSQLMSGIEVKDLAYVGVFTKYAEIPEPIRRFNDRMKKVFKAYNYRGWMSTEVRIGKDHNPYMIDACFSEDTEVLTKNGWKRFPETTSEDVFATMNLESGDLEYQKATRYIEYQYQGDMVRISNRKKTIDCLVTPDHDIVRTDRNKKTVFKQKADSLTDKGFIPRIAKYSGGDESDFILPAYSYEWDFIGQYGHHICKKEVNLPEIKIPLADWASFMGWYLSEGSTSGSGVTQISQEKFVEQLQKDLDPLPFDFKYTGKGFRCCNTQLTSYLKKYGLCNEKRVPQYIRNSSPFVIQKFLSSFFFGDGSAGDAQGRERYFTTSEVMAGDLQEMLFKVGKVANIHRKKISGTKMSVGLGKTYVRNHDIFVVEAVEKSDFWFETGIRKDKYITNVPYDGMVYCVSVPNGTLVVRRNGKCFISGNCTRSPSPPNELWQELYSNFADIVWYGANGIVVDPEPTAKYGAEVLIHSSWASGNWQPVDIDPAIRQWVKLRNAMKINGREYISPMGDGLPEIGAVIGLSDKSIEDAIEVAIKHCDGVSGYYLEMPTAATDKAIAAIEKMDKLGLNYFT